MNIPSNTHVIDATGLIAGRMASLVAKRLLLGDNIVIVNAEKAIISGKRLSLIKRAKEFLQVGHPRKGPIHHRSPDQILRRTTRGMLPRKKVKGKKAYRRLKVFNGVPKTYMNEEKITIPQANANRLSCPYITLGELAKNIGWKYAGE